MIYKKLIAGTQRIYFFCVLFLFSDFALACPMCAGSDTGKDRFTVWVLGAFVLLTYIPYTIIYRLSKKVKSTKKKYNENSDLKGELDDNSVSPNP